MFVVSLHISLLLFYGFKSLRLRSRGVPPNQTALPSLTNPRSSLRINQSEEHRAVGGTDGQCDLIRRTRSTHIEPVCAQAGGACVRLDLQRPARVIHRPTQREI